MQVHTREDNTANNFVQNNFTDYSIQLFNICVLLIHRKGLTSPDFPLEIITQINLSVYICSDDLMMPRKIS